MVETALARDCGVANLTSWDEKEYFHYRPLLSASYARILSAKNNPAEMICDLVREHSRIYPRPVTIGTFQEEPFNLKPEELQELMQSFPKDPKLSSPLLRSAPCSFIRTSTSKTTMRTFSRSTSTSTR